MILLLLAYLRTAAFSRPASFLCEPPRLVGPRPYYSYILSTGRAAGCEPGHDTGVISTTTGGHRTLVVTRCEAPTDNPMAARPGRLGSGGGNRLGSAGQPGIMRARA